MPQPQIHIGLARADLIYRLAVLTENRSTAEQEALLAFAAHLDHHKPRPPRLEDRRTEVERTWEEDS